MTLTSILILNKIYPGWKRNTNLPADILVMCMDYLVTESKHGNTFDGRREGKWEFYSGSSLLFRGTYINGEKHGFWETYYINGKINMIETYDMGSKEGEHKRYFTNGNLECVEIFEHNILTGKAIYYYNTGHKKSEGVYINGQNHGEWIYYHSNGEVQSRGVFYQARMVGKWIEYDFNGLIKRTVTYNDKGHIHGKEVKYTYNMLYPNYRTEIVYENDKPVGEMLDIDDNEKIIYRSKYS